MYSYFILNLYIIYELNTWPCKPANNFLLKCCLFDKVKLVRKTIKSDFTYNGWGIASIHASNRNNNVLVSGEVPAQGIDDSTGAAEKRISIEFSKANAKFYLSLHCNGDDS